MAEIKERTLVKIGGEAIKVNGLYSFLRSLTDEYELLIIYGAGAEISAELERVGVSFKFVDAGRVIDGEDGKRLALEMLEKQGEVFQRKLQEQGINVVNVVTFPSEIWIGNERFNFNGDVLALGLSVNYPKTYIVAVREEDEEKQARKEAKKAKLKQEGYNIEIVWL